MQERTTPPTQLRATPAQTPTLEPEPVEKVLLGRYRVLETNNEGGFGSVSICWDALLTRRVAIKQIPLVLGEVSSQRISTVEEALKEARTSSMLAHKNIVTVFDFQTDDRYSYIVMEYVDGLTLSDLLARVEDGVLSFDECAHLVDSLASALGYAHENRVLHLDIKPANIMIDRTGTVKLADFGMATLASAAGYGGARGGTIGYMPPEQIDGAQVDERTDVFSLAVVVWQALTGTCPFAANSLEEARKKVLAGPRPLLSQVEPSLAGVVEGTLLRALDPNPVGRMPTVSEFAQRIVSALGDTSEGAESLADLINQTEQDEEPHPLEDWERLRVPITARVPWIGSACSRLLAAATAGYVAHATIPILLPESSKALVFGTGGVIAASVAWPPLSGALGVLAIAGALIAEASRGAALLAALVGVAGLLWWVIVGRDDDLAGVALLLPGCLSSPLGGAGIAGFSLSPGRAFLTGALSWFFGTLLRLTQLVGYSFDALYPTLAQLAIDPNSWIASLGSGVAAALCAVFTRRRGVVTRLVGQVVAVMVPVLFAALGAYVKNDSIVNTLDGTAMGVAVFLGATLCIATALAGESVTNGER